MEANWFKPRRYLHFDPAVGLEEAETYVKNESKVASHSFYPFIKRIQRRKRYKKVGEDGEREIRIKSRRICYASHLDAHVYAYYAHLLDLEYERFLSGKAFEESVLAYRSLGENNIHFAREVFSFIAEEKACVVLAFDVEGFFDNLNHRILKRAWADAIDEPQLPEPEYHIYRSLTRYSYVKESRLEEEFDDFFDLPRSEQRVRNLRICTPREFRSRIRGNGLVLRNETYFGNDPDRSRGIPQGSPISALLSNVYMSDFDNTVSELTLKAGGMYRRYSDDLIVVCSEEDANEIESRVQREIGKCKLNIQPEKTDRYRFEKSNGRLQCYKGGTDQKAKIQYLGFNFKVRRCTIRQSSLTRYYRRMNRAVREAAHRAQETPKEEEGPSIRRRKLYERFSHLGDRNFIRYAYEAAKIMDDAPKFDGRHIRSQVKRHWRNLNEAIEEKELEFSN